MTLIEDIKKEIYFEVEPGEDPEQRRYYAHDTSFEFYDTSDIEGFLIDAHDLLESILEELEGANEE